MKIRKLDQHFRALCKKHEVKVRLYKPELFPEDGPPSKGLNGCSDRENRIVYIPKIRSRVSYAIAMHELGHVIGPWQSSTVLIREAGAWKWVRDNVLTWGKSEEKTMRLGMLSHFTAAMEEHLLGLKNALAFPKRGHYFWQCMPELKDRPTWLSEGLHVVPWQKVMADSQRPRCATCLHWEPHHMDTKGSEWGTCTSPEEPMGVRPMVPEEALCGRDYLPNL